MSGDLITQEGVGYRKKKIVETTCSPTVPKIIRFAHEFAGGESSFSLQALTTPVVMLANGFMNPSPAELSGIKISQNRTSLRLYSSSNGGRLVDFDSYTVIAGIIQLLGFKAPPGLVIFGELSTFASNPIVVGDSRTMKRTITLTAGQTIVPVGFTYKVGVNLSTNDQEGALSVTKNGISRLLRNSGNTAAAISADGNYQEVDAGSSYGTTIVLDIPAVSGDFLLIQGDTLVSSGQIQLFSDLERLQGMIFAMANDLTSLGKPLANYLTASPSEIDRRAFGDLVVSLLARVKTIESQPVVATGGTGTLTTIGSPGAPQVINPASGIVNPGNPRQAIWVSSTSGAQTVTAAPQIQAGAHLGDELFILGTSDTNYLTLSDGSGLSLNGPILLKRNISLHLLWDGLVWNEISRK